MNRFKIGDRVRVTGHCNKYRGHPMGTVGAITNKVIYLGDAWYTQSDTNSCRFYNAECDLELISSTLNNMNIKEKFLLAFKSEPEKSFRQAGITNGDDFLTDDGEKIFLGWLLKQNGAAFKTEVVDALLADDKATK